MQDTIRCTQEVTDVMLGFAADLSSRCSEIGEAMDTLVKAAAQTSTVKELANLARTSRR